MEANLVRYAILLVSMVAALSLLGAAPPPTEESAIVIASEDAYVVTDISNTDTQGLKDKNFGNLDFVKVWYAFQVQAQEQMLSVGLFKFDLTGVADKDLRSAHLQLFGVRADLSEAARLVDVSLAEGTWAQDSVTFSTLPQVITPPLSTAAVYGANVWYSWDVTSAVVRKARDGSVTLAVGLRALENKKEEQVVFASSRAGRNAPRLVISYPITSPSVPLYALPVGVGAAALLAFAIGLVLGLRRRRAAALRVPATHDVDEPEAALPRS
jgi:hypothetical protein